jgi:hypothetical protein
MCFNPEFEEISGDSRAKPSLSDLNQGESGVCLQVQGFLYGRPEVAAVHAEKIRVRQPPALRRFSNVRAQPRAR